MATTTMNKRGMVELKAFRADGTLVEEVEMDFEDYCVRRRHRE